VIVEGIDKTLEECYKNTAVFAKVFFPNRFFRDFCSMHYKLFEVLDDPSIRELFTKEVWEIWMRSQTGERIPAGYIMPRGSRQQIRGHIIGKYRPDLFFADDIEKSKEVKSDDQRRETKDWFFADVINAVDKGLGGPNWRIIVTGTLLHEDCLLLDLINDSAWEHVDMPLCDTGFKSFWPGYMTDEMVKEEVDEYRRQGRVDIFYRERMNVPVAGEDRVFKPEFFKHYDDDKVIGGNHKIENVIIIDPAKTTKIHSAETAICGIGLDYENAKVYLRDVVSEKLHPEEIYLETFAMAKRLNAWVIGVEVTSLHEFIMYPMKSLAMRKGLTFEWVELNARGKKAERVRELVPLYRAGQVYHYRPVAGKIEVQLLSFPYSRLWDVMDCFAYVLPLLERGERYFEAEVENPENEYKELEEDEYADEPIGNYGII